MKQKGCFHPVCIQTVPNGCSQSKKYQHSKNIRNWEFHKGRWAHKKSNKYFLWVWGTLECANMPLLLKGGTWLVCLMVLSKVWCNCRTRVTRHSPNCLSCPPSPAKPGTLSCPGTPQLLPCSAELQWAHMPLYPQRQMANYQHLHSRFLTQKCAYVNVHVHVPVYGFTISRPKK